MSASVRVAGSGRRGRLICVGAGLFLASGGAIAALLAVTSMATANLVAAASHRPGALADWRQPQVASGAGTSAGKWSALFAEHDAEFGRGGSKALGEKLATLGAEMSEARVAQDQRPSAVRIASLGPAPARAIEPVPAPRVIAPAPPVEASVVPPTPVVRLAALEQPAPAPAIVEPMAVERPLVAEPVVVPVPRPRPVEFARLSQPVAPLRAEATVVRPETKAPGAPSPRPTALAYAAPETETKTDTPGGFFSSLLGRDDASRLLSGRRGIAIYDIASATVRLPNGERLEAHSGLAHRQDNAAYVREKNRGPTPPNVYDMRMREALFHGTEAIRLLPRDQKKVFNRDGLLAHSYMYAGGGPRSQSNGCVVFKDYGRFLRAFKAGEIAKLVVVPNMAALPTYMAGL
ncbi:DUF2778 domain-containing protein [Chenggangzhangella methanolivorans]|uniref:DUF2778 domain-containing protein n=1 Tax=Chenggangzhangella methanolivorans TaxID=1437009 RepID=A0A9E6RA38_9HYPH|nr:DUF2778 domain-containing protein [Chenggangzhangella methanolivorans]QZO00075.1 DUF2778 domain-containing protein [Chenggangzhangella methanolivorans]